MVRIFLVIFILTLASECSNNRKKPDNTFYSVLSITDGDTFRITGSPKGQVIRLIGVDAPESRNTGRKLVAAFGKEASDYLKKLLDGRKVRLEYDVDRKDRYGRTLAYVYLEDGTFVNAEMVKNGYANVMTVPPNVKFQELFLKLERRARSRGMGLWSGDR